MSSMKTSQPEASTYAEHAADIVDAAVQAIQGEERFALITSLAIEGGAAREVGSLAIVKPDGTMVGYLSNGCIDRDISSAHSWHCRTLAKRWCATVRGLGILL